MPDFAVASSNRMGEVAGACASKVEDSNASIRVWAFTLVSSCCAMLGRAREVGGCRGLQQNQGYGILRRGLGAGVTSDAETLFAATHPEESGFALYRFSRRVEEFDPQRLLAGDLDKK